mgnify:CR=1 FL=1
MDGWMDGSLDGWIDDGLMDGWIEEWMDRWIDQQMDTKFQYRGLFALFGATFYAKEALSLPRLRGHSLDPRLLYMPSKRLLSPPIFMRHSPPIPVTTPFQQRNTARIFISQLWVASQKVITYDFFANTDIKPMRVLILTWSKWVSKKINEGQADRQTDRRMKGWVDTNW